MISHAPVKIIKNEIAYLELYEDYILSSVNEGILIDDDILHWFLMLFDKYYPKKKFGYITNRINQYSLDPTVYPLLAMHNSLEAMAVISYTNLGQQNAFFEKGFFNKPFDVFSNIEEAKNWVFSVLHINKKKVDL